MGVPPLVHLSPLDSTYPSRLRRLARPPSTLTIGGGSLEAARAVAVVGSREAHGEAAEFAHKLAVTLARAQIVVVSGGALGIDAAAHRGALDGGGRTWAVAGTGHERCFPEQHSDLYDSIAAGPGAMVWPFAPATEARGGNFVARNRVLVALSDAVVVVQAGPLSGALNAADWATKLRVPLWVVPAPPWLGPGFDGSRGLLDQGRARALQSVDSLLSSLAPQGPSGALPPPPRPLSAGESAVLEATSSVPLHLDEIALRAQSPAPAVLASLLTLALENVVVEGPPGFFRRQPAP